MNKKGSFGIFITITTVVCFFIGYVIWPINTIEIINPIETYDDMSENYIHELNLIKNKAILEGKDPNYEAQKFTDLYLKQMQEVDPNFGVITIYKDLVTGNIIIKNSMLSGDWITIESDVLKGEGILLSGYDQMEGKIQVGGLMSFNVGTNLNTYGEELSTLKVSPDADYIKICLPSYGTSACFDILKNENDSWDSKSIIVSQLCPTDAEGELEEGFKHVDETGNTACTQEVTVI